ncbi:MAG: C40 family peptidase [Roseinatronobacter sp.]
MSTQPGTDPRLTPFSGRVAHLSLKGRIVAPAFTEGTPMRLCASLTDLRRSPGGPRDRQLLLGARLHVIDEQDGWAYVMTDADSYCGWLRSDALTPDHPVTHRIHAPASHLYSAPDLKSPEAGPVPLNARLQITTQSGRFLGTAQGLWVPAQHATPCDQHQTDPVSVAETLRGAPYLWGGNSAAGLDCSALVQLALQACGQPCPADSDLQERALGRALPENTRPERGDLLFWRGHVAWVSGPDQILHANAHTMSVANEPLQAARARIAHESPVTAHRRLEL